MFEIKSGYWAWVSGSNLTQNKGIYGERGVSALENIPGARHRHSILCDPARNQLHLFGGEGIDSLWSFGK